MTLLYAGVFFVAGLLLLVASYIFVRQTLTDQHNLRDLPGASWSLKVEYQREVAADALSNLRRLYAVALGAMTGLSVLLGWAMAGRVLRPLQRITATAKRVSQDNLDERIALEGPRDEQVTLRHVGEQLEPVARPLLHPGRLRVAQQPAKPRV